jgi:hypothetical protein
MMEGFDDEASRPVSAAFPPPRTSAEHEVVARRKEPNLEEDAGDESDSSESRSPIALLRDQVQTNHQKHKEELQSPDGDVPLVEVVSQEAIEELIDVIFMSAGSEADQMLDYDKFVTVVMHDMNLLSWFEALGPIF